MKKWVIYLVFLLALVSVASAQYYYTDRGFGSGGFGIGDITEFYNAYPYWFDFFISLIIFFSLGKIVFGGDQYKRGSKGLTIGIALALSFGLILWESRTGFNLGDIWLFALLVLLFTIGMAIYRYIKNIGLSWKTLAILSLILGFGGYYLLGDYLDSLPIFILYLIYFLIGAGVLGFFLWILDLLTGGREGRAEKKSERRAERESIREERRSVRSEKRAKKREEKERIREEGRAEKKRRNEERRAEKARLKAERGEVPGEKGRGREKLKRIGRRKRAEREEKKLLRELEPKFKQFLRNIDGLYRLLSTKPNESTLRFVEQTMYKLLDHMRIFSSSPEYLRRVRNKMKILKNKFYEVKSKVKREIVIKKKTKTVKPKSELSMFYNSFKRDVKKTINLITSSRGQIDWDLIKRKYADLKNRQIKFIGDKRKLRESKKLISVLRGAINSYRRIYLSSIKHINILKKEINGLRDSLRKARDVGIKKSIENRIKIKEKKLFHLESKLRR